MRISGEFDYRNAKAIINATYPSFLTEIYDVLTNGFINLAATGGQRALSRQVKDWFINSTIYSGWQEEQPCFSVPFMIYDLLKNGVPIPMAGVGPTWLPLYVYGRNACAT